MLRFLAALLGFVAVWCAWAKHFSIDEFQYAHASWLVANGQVPYLDFFEFHQPLPYQLGALVMLPLGDDPTNVHWLRVWNLLPVLAIVWAAAKWARTLAGDAAAGFAAIICLLGTWEQTTLLTEFRPDVLALAYFLLAVVSLHETGWSDRRAAFTSGLCMAISVWSSQKALLYGVLFALAFAHDLWPGRKARLLRSPWLFAAGFTTYAALVLVYLLSTGSLAAWFDACFRWAAYHEADYPGFSPWRYLGPTLWKNPLLIGLMALGAWRTRGYWLIGALGCTLGSFFKATAPFPYALIPFLALASVAAGVGASRVKLAPLALLLITGIGAWRIGQSVRETNRAQLDTLATLGRLTAATDPVFDSSGSMVARPHVGFRYYTNALILSREKERLHEEVPRDLEASGCTAALIDFRYQYLPQPVRAYVEARFQPYAPDLWLWGTRLNSDAVTVPQTARYFVHPEGAQVLLDGRPRTGIFPLMRGAHAVEPSEGAWLLWLPEDGQRWAPVSQRTGTFGQLF